MQNFFQSGGLSLDKAVKQKSLLPYDRYYGNNLDTVLICVGLLILAFTHYGSAVLYQTAVCLLSGALWDFVFFTVILKKNAFRSLRAASTSLLIAALLPASAPLYVGAVAVFLAELTVFLFKDGRSTLLAPAAVGFCIAALIFPAEVFTYPIPSADGIAFYAQEGFTKGVDLLTSISDGKGVSLNLFGISSLLSGNISGAMGTTSLLAMAGIAVYRLIRSPRSLISSVFYLIGTGAFALLLPRLHTDPVTVIVTELSAGSLLFTAFMLINEPVTSPQRAVRAMLYGLVAGVLTMVLRYYTPLYDSPLFALLIMNLLWPLISRETVNHRRLPKEKKKKEKPIKEKAKKNKKDYTPSYDLFSEEAETEVKHEG